MIAWVAFALIVALWLLLFAVIGSAVRAARDPKTMAKLLARMMPKPRSRPIRSGNTLENVEVRIRG